MSRQKLNIFYLTFKIFKMEKKWLKDGKFTVLEKNELEELTDEQAVEYHSDLIKSEVKSEVENLVKDLNIATKEEIEAVNNSLKVLKESTDIAEIKTNLGALQNIVKNSNSRISAKDVVETFESKEVREFLTNKDNYKLGKRMVVKATSSTGDIHDNQLHNVIPGIARVENARPVLSDLFSRMPISKNTNRYYYVDWFEATSAAASISENGDFPTTSSVDFKGYELTLEKVGDSMKVTEEMMRFYTSFVNEIKFFLQNNVQVKENQLLATGDGTSPNISGIYTQVNAFNYGAYSGATTADPNLIDLIKVLRNEIEKNTSYKVDTILVNPDDLLELQLTKDANGIPLYDIIVKNLGVKIVATPYITANTAVIGDFKMARFIRSNGYELELGRSEDDFDKDLYTLKARIFMNLLVRHAELSAFLKVTSISNALTAITTL